MEFSFTVQVLKETPVDTTFLPLIGFNSTIALKLNGYIDYGSIYFILTPANTLLRQMDFFYFIDVRIGLYIEGVYYNMFSLNSLSIERCVASSESNPTFTDIDDIEFHVNCTTMLYAYDIVSIINIHIHVFKTKILSLMSYSKKASIFFKLQTKLVFTLSLMFSN